MTPQYLHLFPGQEPPAIERKPYRLIIVADAEVADDWRDKIAKWIVAAGTKYVVAWGASCEDWHDSVDWANLRLFDFGEISDADSVMTTWHNDEPLSEAFWFAGFCAHHPIVDLDSTIILHISEKERAAGILEQYRVSQVTEPEE